MDKNISITLCCLIKTPKLIKSIRINMFNLFFIMPSPLVSIFRIPHRSKMSTSIAYLFHSLNKFCFNGGKHHLNSLAMDSGTTVVYSANGDIKRPICGSIDVHKKILMAAVCKTDPETLKATFYVRKFTTMNSDIRTMAIWMKEHGVEDVCMESTGKY